MRLNPKKISYDVFLNFEALFGRAMSFVDKATNWEDSVLNEAEDYHTNNALLIEYESLTSYYQRKYRVNCEKVNKMRKRKEITAELKCAFTSVRSIFLFWIPLIVIVGLIVVTIKFGDYELSDDIGSSPLFYIAIAVIIYSVFAFIATFYLLYISIRDGLHAKSSVVETLSDFLNNRVKNKKYI